MQPSIEFLIDPHYPLYWACIHNDFTLVKMIITGKMDEEYVKSLGIPVEEVRDAIESSKPIDYNECKTLTRDPAIIRFLNRPMSN